jgi:hypothetical protein
MVRYEPFCTNVPYGPIYADVKRIATTGIGDLV